MDAEHTAENPWGLEPLFDVGELAAYLGVPVSTFYDWRTALDTATGTRTASCRRRATPTAPRNLR